MKFYFVVHIYKMFFQQLRTVLSTNIRICLCEKVMKIVTHKVQFLTRLWSPAKRSNRCQNICSPHSSREQIRQMMAFWTALTEAKGVYMLKSIM